MTLLVLYNLSFPKTRINNRILSDASRHSLREAALKVVKICVGWGCVTTGLEVLDLAIPDIGSKIMINHLAVCYRSDTGI